jgi:hypothetical protein
LTPAEVTSCPDPKIPRLKDPPLAGQGFLD